MRSLLLGEVILLWSLLRFVGELIKRQPLSRNPTSVALSNDRHQGSLQATTPF